MATYTKESCHSITSKMTFYFLGYPCFSLLYSFSYFSFKDQYKTWHKGYIPVWMQTPGSTLRVTTCDNHTEMSQYQELPRTSQRTCSIAQNLQSFSILKD